MKNIVRSEVYIGNMVQGKTGTLSYKSRKLINKPEEEWIRVEGTHEPISGFQICQELKNKNCYPRPGADFQRSGKG